MFFTVILYTMVYEYTNQNTITEMSALGCVRLRKAASDEDTMRLALLREQLLLKYFNFEVINNSCIVVTQIFEVMQEHRV